MTEIEQNEVKHTRRQKEMRKKYRISEDESREGDDREIAREVKRRFQRKQEMARRTNRGGNRTEMKNKFNNKN